MGKMKEMHMEMREQEQNQNTNQLNNQMAKKTMQEKLTKQPEIVVETRTEALRRLYKENGLTAEDVHKDPRGFVTIKREGTNPNSNNYDKTDPNGGNFETLNFKKASYPTKYIQSKRNKGSENDNSIGGLIGTGNKHEQDH